MWALIVTDIIIPDPGIEDIGQCEIGGLEIVIARHGITGTTIIMADTCGKNYLYSYRPFLMRTLTYKRLCHWNNDIFSLFFLYLNTIDLYGFRNGTSKQKVRQFRVEVCFLNGK